MSATGQHEDLQRILYVEDEASMRAIVQVALEDMGGFELRLAATGQEALRIAAEYDPQLIIMDVMMPGMNGPATLRAMREIPALSNVPVVFMTAMDDQEEIQGFKEMGVADVILKPIDPTVLAKDVEEIWRDIAG